MRTEGRTVPKLSAEKVAAILPLFFEKNLPVLLVGRPGTAKTSLVKQAVDKLGWELILSHPVVSDPTDYKGLPFPSKDGKSADFIPFGDLQKLINATEPTVFFLDDLGQAAPAVQAAAMQLLLGREINGHKISDHVRFAAATNGKKDKANVSGILEPVKSRFVTIIEVDVSVPGWIKWALDAGISLEVISFINLKGIDALCNFQPTTDMTNSALPRTIENLDSIYRAFDGAGVTDRETQYACYAGAAGESVAAAFLAYLDVCNDLPDLTLLIADPEGSKIPDKVSVQCAICAALSRLATEGNFGQILKYAQRLRGDFRYFLVKSAILRDEELTKTRAFRDWALRNQNLLT